MKGMKWKLVWLGVLIALAQLIMGASLWLISSAGLRGAAQEGGGGIPYAVARLPAAPLTEELADGRAQMLPESRVSAAPAAGPRDAAPPEPPEPAAPAEEPGAGLIPAAVIMPPQAGEYLGEFLVYAYCNCPSCCGRWSPYHGSRAGTGYEHRTASGTELVAGRTAAADWGVLPPGTEVVVGGQAYTVEDRGKGIAGYKLDLYFGDWADGAHERALEWGVRRVEVYAARAVGQG